MVPGPARPTSVAEPPGIDAHVHLMAYDPLQHDWVTDELRALRRDFSLDDLQPLLATSGFGGCVAVEARPHPAENDFLLVLARPSSGWRVVRGSWERARC